MEWVADHDDQAITKRVRVRVFERHNGVCHISKRKDHAGQRQVGVRPRHCADQRW